MAAGTAAGEGLLRAWWAGLDRSADLTASRAGGACEAASLGAPGKTRFATNTQRGASGAAATRFRIGSRDALLRSDSPYAAAAVPRKTWIAGGDHRRPQVTWQPRSPRAGGGESTRLARASGVGCIHHRSEAPPPAAAEGGLRHHGPSMLLGQAGLLDIGDGGGGSAARTTGNRSLGERPGVPLRTRCCWRTRTAADRDDQAAVDQRHRYATKSLELHACPLKSLRSQTLDPPRTDHEFACNSSQPVTERAIEVQGWTVRSLSAYSWHRGAGLFLQGVTRKLLREGWLAVSDCWPARAEIWQVSAIRALTVSTPP